MSIPYPPQKLHDSLLDGSVVFVELFFCSDVAGDGADPGKKEMEHAFPLFLRILWAPAPAMLIPSSR